MKSAGSAGSSLVGLLVGLAACGGDGSGPNPPDGGSPPALAVDSAAASPRTALWPDIEVYFSRAVEPATVTTASVTVRRGGVAVPVSIQVSPDSRSALLQGPFVAGASYTVTVAGSVTGADSVPVGTPRNVTLTIRSAASAAVAPTNTFAVQPLVVQNGRVHVVTFGTGTMYYSTCQTGCSSAFNWQTAVIDNATAPDGNADLAIDAAGALHVSYHATSPLSLRYASCQADCATASNWQTVRVDSTANRGNESAIALDAAGQVHITYINYNTTGLWYAVCSTACSTPAGWATAQLVSSLLDPREPALAASPEGTLSAFIRGQESGYPVYYLECGGACTEAANWQKVKFLDSFLGFGGSLDLDATGRRHLAYFANGDRLRYASCAANCLQLFNWASTELDRNAAGVLTALARGPDGRLMIAYGGASGTLTVAACSSNCPAPNRWQAGPLTVVGNTGNRPAIGLDGNGQPHVLSNGSSLYLE